MERKRIGKKNWQTHIELQRKSGQGISAYCKEAGLSESGFYLWRKKLQQPTSQTGFEQIEFNRQRSELIITTPNGYQVQAADAEACIAVARKLVQC